MRRTLLLSVSTTMFLGACGSVGLQDVPVEVVSAGQDPAQDEPADGTYGNAAETTMDLSDRLYTVALGDLTVVEPPGLDGMKEQFLDRDMLVYVADEAADVIALDVALAAADGTQNPCERVLALPEGEWTNPSFEVGPGELTTTFAGGNPATFQQLRMRGVFDADGASWDGSLSAVLDARELAPAVPEVDDICALVDALGGTCTACADGAASCFALELDDMHGERVNRSFDPSPTCE